MRQHCIACVLCAGLVAFAFLSRGAEVSSEPAVLARGTDVIQAWRAQQHLYVKGNLGVSASQLAGLEQWLDANATNWVVVLLESSEGERYTDPEGATFTGVEAVNHALGKGLMNQAGFGQSLDPRTRERNACFFALFLKDRRFSYYGSDAQDRRGLGEEEWIGNLDAPAIRAMRSGGRIVDAVRDTITHIEQRLTERIVAERETAARKAAEEEAGRARAQAQARAGLAAGRDALKLLTERTTAFGRQHPDATGDLARPDLAGIEGTLAAAEASLEAGRMHEASEAAAGVRKRVEAALTALDRHANAARQFEAWAARYQQAAQQPHAAAATASLREAAERLQAARQEHARGDSSYEAHLAATGAALKASEGAIASAARAAKTRLLLAAFAASSVLSLLGVLGAFLNRRRAKTMLEARRLHEVWTQGMSEKTDGLFALLDRRATVVGASTLDAEQRYAGRTLELSRQAIKDVDELFIMSACVDRILSEARALLEPRSLASRIGNLVRRGRYERVLRLLKDEPIRFKPEERLELIVRGPRTERDRLLGDLRAYQPFAMTFSELVAAFNERAARALAALDEIESSVIECSKAAEIAQASCERARAEAERLGEAAATDGLFGLDSVTAKLLPRATEELAAALRQAATDPVGALAGPGSRAKQQAGDAAELAACAWRVREKLMPPLRENRTALQESGISVGWIEAALGDLSNMAEQAAMHAIETSAAEQITEFAQAADALAARASKALALDQRRRDLGDLAGSQLREKVSQARRQLGGALRLDPARTLGERDLNPDECLTGAEAQLASARSALDRGDVKAAENALDAAATLAGEAEEIVRATLDVFGRRDAEVAALREESRRLEGLLPGCREVLAGMTARYAASTLLLGSGDPAHPKANGTVADNIAEAEESLASAGNHIQRAEAIFAGARLLEAADFWERVKADHEIAALRLQELEEKQERLRQTEETIRTQLTGIDSRTAALDQLVASPSTRRPTIALLETARQSLDRLRSEVGAIGGDPFALATDLEAIRSQLAEVEDKARCDRDVFEEATRSVQAAAAQLRQAHEIAASTRNSGLPASSAMEAALAELEPLATPVRTLQSLLDQPHEDWAVVDAEADQISSRAATLAATIQGEIARAQDAVAAVSSAAAAVRSVGAWTGGLGVAIAGSPGSDVLENARRLLQRGTYDQARALAETARRMANAAVAQAEAEVMRRRAAEQARLEHERRLRRAAERARQARRISQSGSGGFGGMLGGGRSGAGSTWGKSGSGFRTSGFRSGSGARTSGW